MASAAASVARPTGKPVPSSSASTAADTALFATASARVVSSSSAIGTALLVLFFFPRWLLSSAQRPTLALDSATGGVLVHCRILVGSLTPLYPNLHKE